MSWWDRKRGPSLAHTNYVIYVLYMVPEPECVAKQNEQERNHSGGQKWMKGQVEVKIQLPWVLFSKLFAASRGYHKGQVAAQPIRRLQYGPVVGMH